MLGYILSKILVGSLYEAIIFSLFINIIKIIHRFCTEVLISVITFYNTMFVCESPRLFSLIKLKIRSVY